MNWDLIKKKVKKEVGPIINGIDPGFDIENSVNIYAKVLSYQISIKTRNDLSGLEGDITRTLNQIYIEDRTDNISIGLFSKNFEQFVKKIYYILEEGGFVRQELDHTKLQTIGAYLNKLNQIKPIYLNAQGEQVGEISLAQYINGAPRYKTNKGTKDICCFKLVPEDIPLSKYETIEDPELNEKYRDNFMLYFIKAYILKNEQSHQSPDRPKHQSLINFNSTLIAELWIIDFFKKELSTAFKKDSFRKKDYHEYINNEIDRLIRLNNKFVSLNLKPTIGNNNETISGLIEDIFPIKINRMRILGQGGSGKTTTLEFLLLQDALKWNESPNNSKIPVIIYLANLDSNENVLTAIANKLNTGIEDIEELLESNDLILYLDGINEIVENRESKRQKIQEIDAIIEEYPNLSIIITDRFEYDSYQSNMFNIPTFLIQKLERSQVKNFIEKYCNNSAEQALLVLDVLSSKNTIQELLLRPLILTRAIEIVKIDNDLPEKEGLIIEKFIDLLLRREKDEKKDPLLNINNFKLLLSYAASEIYNKYKTNASVHDFAFNKLLVEGNQKFGLETFNAGYITRIAFELEILMKMGELIQFFHQSYLDYFCSRYIKYESI